MYGSYGSVMCLAVLVLVQGWVGEGSGRDGGSESELSAVVNNEGAQRRSRGSSSVSSKGNISSDLRNINNSQAPFSSGRDQLSRLKRGFFDKDLERQRKEEEYDKSFRLFWLLGGIAIVLFICVFILTLLCLCCPNCHAKGAVVVRKGRTEPQQEPEFPIPCNSAEAVDLVNRIRSASVISSTNSVLLCPQYRLSQEQVNAIQNRRSSNLLLAQGGAGAGTTGALVDVNVVQETQAEVA